MKLRPRLKGKVLIKYTNSKDDDEDSGDEDTQMDM